MNDMYCLAAAAIESVLCGVDCECVRIRQSRFSSLMHLMTRNG